MAQRQSPGTPAAAGDVTTRSRWAFANLVVSELTGLFTIWAGLPYRRNVNNAPALGDLGAWFSVRLVVSIALFLCENGNVAH